MESKDQPKTDIQPEIYDKETGRCFITLTDLGKETVQCSKHGHQDGWWFYYAPHSRALVCPGCLENEVGNFLPAIETFGINETTELKEEEEEETPNKCCLCIGPFKGRCADCGGYFCEKHLSPVWGDLCLDCGIAKDAANGFE